MIFSVTWRAWYYSWSGQAWQISVWMKVYKYLYLYATGLSLEADNHPSFASWKLHALIGALVTTCSIYYLKRSESAKVQIFFTPLFNITEYPSRYLQVKDLLICLCPLNCLIFFGQSIKDLYIYLHHLVTASNCLKLRLQKYNVHCYSFLCI